MNKYIIIILLFNAISSQIIDDEFLKRIRHDFIMNSSPTMHRMTMNLVKDSLEEELDVTGPVEPTDIKSTVVKYEYN